jgi:hypothetical protein
VGYYTSLLGSKELSYGQTMNQRIYIVPNGMGLSDLCAACWYVGMEEKRLSYLATSSMTNLCSWVHNQLMKQQHMQS